MPQGFPDPELRQQLREIEKLRNRVRALRAQFVFSLALSGAVIVSLIIHLSFHD